MQVDLNEHNISVAVLQPTPFCNIDCKYCYLPDRSSTCRMTLETLEQSLQFLFSLPDLVQPGFTILWHACEPLVMPVDFYEEALRLLARIKPDSIPVAMSFQTNGTLIDQEYCAFLRRSKAIVGVSLDGPRWLHDLHRLERSGRGTFDRVMRGIDLLRQNGVAFDIFPVITEHALAHADELWNFFQGVGASGICFNFEDVSGVHKDTSLRGPGVEARARRFLERIFELRNAHAPGFHIRETDCLIDVIQGWPGALRHPENQPLSVINIGWDGSVSTFSPELLGVASLRYGDFVLGNVATHTIRSILESAKFQAIYGEIANGVQRCRHSCEYFSVCGGGSPAAKLFETGSFDAAETLACTLNDQMPTDIALDHLERQHHLPLGAPYCANERLKRVQRTKRSASHAE